ncbi:MAG: hypothetical protein M3Q71_13220 [Chloroflexota bacterium]|nr:hypothetical protein [Chloroflexota bacterium]
MTSPVDIAAVLATSALLPGPEGYDLAELMATVEGHGWTCWVEPMASAADERDRWRAMVFEAGKEAVVGRRRGYRGRGLTQADALASALARMLARRRA